MHNQEQFVHNYRALIIVYCCRLHSWATTQVRSEDRERRGREAWWNSVSGILAKQRQLVPLLRWIGSQWNYVITASHCVSGKTPKQIKVVAGTVDLTQAASQHNVQTIIMHEKYNAADSWNNDIALLKVEKPFVKSKQIAFVQLPTATDTVYANQLATVSGWGRLWQGGPTTVHLQRVNILIADQEYCRLIYNKQHYNIYDSHVCAYDPTVEKGSCHGDSGGPLTVNGKLTGLVSWAMGCALTDYPTVYTRVSSHLDWIKTHAVWIEQMNRESQIINKKR